MIIEDLIRLGKPYLESDISLQEIIKQVTDVASPSIRNFWRHVWIVEIKDEKAAVFNVCWGKEDENGFIPDYGKISAAPISIPAGGNKILPQGYYPTMTYPLFDIHFSRFIKTSKEVKKFLEGRFRKTEYRLDDKTIDKISNIISQKFKDRYKNDKDKKLGVLMIIPIKDDGIYYHTNNFVADKNIISIEESRISQDKYISVDLKKITELVWRAKENEGKEKGYLKKGQCDITGEKGIVLSCYNKTWPWYTTTWDAPFSIYQNKNKLTDSISLSSTCYRFLTYGANLVKRLTQRIPYWLAKELFSPAESIEAKDYIREVENIYGFVYILPIIDSFLEREDERQIFINSIDDLLKFGEANSKGSTRKHLENILQLENIFGLVYSLPQDLQKDTFRLTAVYYSGNIDRGDIHLHAIVEDVIPSTISKTEEILCDVLLFAEDVSKILEIRLETGKHHFDSLPYLLIKAYGGPYMWPSLSKILHRRTLNYQRFVKNCALRMNELGKKLHENFYEIKFETLFYFIFIEFLNSYHKEILNRREGYMENWKELYNEVCNLDNYSLRIENPAEAGFVAGLLTRKFSQQYYASQMEKTGATPDKKSYDTRKSFISQRVMAYGSTLTPDIIYKRALSKFKEYGIKLEINLSRDFEKKNSFLLLYYLDNTEKIQRNKDDFMAAFWAGYGLGIPSKKEEEDVK